MNYEYGIRFSHEDELHRGPMSKEAAQEWIEDFEELGGRPGAVILVVRSVSDWREVH